MPSFLGISRDRSNLQCQRHKESGEEVGHRRIWKPAGTVKEQTWVAVDFAVPVGFPFLYKPDNEDNCGSYDKAIVSVAQSDCVSKKCAAFRKHDGAKTYTKWYGDPLPKNTLGPMTPQRTEIE